MLLPSSSSLREFKMQHEESANEDVFNLFKNTKLVASFLIEEDGELGVASIYDSTSEVAVYYRFKGPGITIDDGASEYVYLRKEITPNYKIVKETGDIYELTDWSHQTFPANRSK